MNGPKRTGPATDEHGTMRISRKYDFPRESVFEMFTDPRKAARWFGSPDGSVKLVFEMDARPGGTIRIHDRHEDGRVYETSGTFVDVVVPERVVFKTATAPSKGTAPFEALQTLTFEAVGPGQTRVTVHVKVLALGAFPGDIDSLVGGYRGGWGQSLAALRRELR